MADIFRPELKVTTLYLQDPNAWWRTWTWQQNLNLRGKDRMVTGEQVWALPDQGDQWPRSLRSWTYNTTIYQPIFPFVLFTEKFSDLPPRDPREVRTWTWNQVRLLTDRGATFSAEVFDLPPRDPREVRSWSWQYNPNLIGQDQLPVGERVYDAPVSAGWYQSWVINLLESTLSVIGLPPGEQAWDRPQLAAPLGALGWAWTYNPNLVGQDQFPPGERAYDLSVPAPQPIEQTWTWRFNLNLRGKDIVPGEQRWDLTTPDARQRREWAWSYNLNLVGQDARLVGEQVFDLTPREAREYRSWVWGNNLALTIQFLPPGLQVYDTPREFRERRGWEWRYNLNLIGQDVRLVGEQIFDRPTGITWYQSWVLNLLQSTLTVVSAPPGAQVYDRPQLSPLPSAPSWTWTYNLNLVGQDQLPIGEALTALTPIGYPRPDETWTWRYNLNLVGRDALPTGKSIYELTPRDPREARGYAINLVLTTLFAQDRMTVGEQVYATTPSGPPPIVPSWQWSYNLNLIGQDAFPVGEIATALPRGPDWLLGWTQNLLESTLALAIQRPFNQYDWPVPRAPQPQAFGWSWAYNANLVGQDSMLVGDQRYDLWVPEPQRPVQTSTWVWQYNLNLVGKDALPVGAKNYDQAPLRVFWQRSWELNLVLSTLRGQDQLPSGEQSWFLPPQPAQPQAFVWTWQYNPNLVGQDALPTGEQRYELATGPDWRLSWTQSLAARLTAAQAPSFPNAWALPSQPIYPTDLRSWLSQTKLLLIGQDALPVGTRRTELVVPAPQPIDQTFSSIGLSLFAAPIVYTVGLQVYDLAPRAYEYPVDLRNSIFGVNPNLYPPPPPPVVVITAVVGDPYDRRKRYRFSQPFAPMDREQYEEMLNYLARSHMNAAERRAYENHLEILLANTEERDIEFLMLDGVL